DGDPVPLERLDGGGEGDREQVRGRSLYDGCWLDAGDERHRVVLRLLRRDALAVLRLLDEPEDRPLAERDRPGAGWDAGVGLVGLGKQLAHLVRPGGDMLKDAPGVRLAGEDAVLERGVGVRLGEQGDSVSQREPLDSEPRLGRVRLPRLAVGREVAVEET